MKRTAKRILPLLFVGMLMHTGCAKQELIKKDEPLAPPAAKAQKASPPTSTAAAAKPATANAVANADAKPKAPAQSGSQGGTTADLQRGLEKVYFSFDASTLTPAARTTLTRNFDLLKKSPQLKVRIEGNCDERGSDEYNLALGERRAQAAARYLTELGVSAERLSTISYGREKPVDPGHDEAAWARNRRDEFVVVK